MKTLIPKIRIIIFTAFFALISFLSYAQSISLSLGSAQTCPGDLTLVPLNVTNLNNIGAITLYIAYDTAVLKYEGHTNAHPQFSGIMSNAVVQPEPMVIIAWSNTAGSNLSNGTLLDLKFTHKLNSCPLVFKPGGEIVTVNLVKMPFTPNNGMISQLPPHIVSQPQNTTVPAGTNAIFTLVANEVDTYQWQQNNGLEWIDLQNSAIYQNVNGPQLIIAGASYSFNGYKFRCRISKVEYCDYYSKEAMLNIIPGGSGLPQVYQLMGGGSYCTGMTPTGIDITLNNSQTGVNYQLYNGPNPVGSSIPGTGNAIVWENMLGGLYMANATNSWGTVNMEGTIIITELQLPELSCPPDNSVSINTTPFELTGATPEDGVYSGTGVADGFFYPNTAGIGNHQIVYTYSDENNCTNTCTFIITVTSAYLPGDANGDGVVNILDPVTISNFIMGNNPQPFIFEAADVNNDGIINIQDFVLTVNIIMGVGK